MVASGHMPMVPVYVNNRGGCITSRPTSSPYTILGNGSWGSHEKNKCTADALSRLWPTNLYASLCYNTSSMLLEYLDSIPVTAKQIKVWKDHDPDRVRIYTLHHGWPDHKIKDCKLKPQAPGRPLQQVMYGYHT